MNRTERRRQWRSSWQINFLVTSGFNLDRYTRRQLWKMSWSKFKNQEVLGN